MNAAPGGLPRGAPRRGRRASSSSAGRPRRARSSPAACFTALEDWLDRHAEEGFGAVRDAWRERSVTLGREVVVKADGRELAGVAEDIDDAGALLVRGPAGLERILAGDVVLLRPR